VLVTDDHASYRDGFMDTDVERQLCLVHVLENIRSALNTTRPLCIGEGGNNGTSEITYKK
jgi:hypothetical protein